MTRKQTTLFVSILGVIVSSTLPATVLAQSNQHEDRISKRTGRQRRDKMSFWKP